MYTLFLVDGAVGSFVGAVRTIYESIMRDIADKCFDKHVFKSDVAQQIIKYAADVYGCELEFLWDKFPEYAVLRRKDNNKWYGVLLVVAKSKLGLPSQDKIEIMDLRINPEIIETVVDGKKFFHGYHMNKKHWITVCLDGSVPIEDIINMLDKSYELARSR